MAHLGVQADQGTAFVEGFPVLPGLQQGLDVPGHEEPVGRVPVDVVPPGLVGLGLQGYPDARDLVHGLRKPLLEPPPHPVEVEPQRVLVAVYPGPDHGELGPQLHVEPQGLLQPVHCVPPYGGVGI